MEALTDAQRDLVERIGVVHDRKGVRPAAGRIIGLLMVTPDGELTFDEIRETLGLSKSAASTALQFLQEVESVTYRTRPGDRKRYFTKNVLDWERRFMKQVGAFLQIRYLMAEAIELKGESDPEGRRALGRMTGFLDVLAEALERAHEEWMHRDRSSTE